MADGQLEDLATAVTDGDAIDWPSAHSRLSASPPQTRRAAQSLETLSALSSQLVVQPGRSSRRLPLLLEFAHMLAVICCVAGLAGFSLGLPGPRPVRAGIMLAILCTFGGAAVYLDIGGRDRRARALAACYWTTATSFSTRGLMQLAQAWPASEMLRVIAALRPEAFFGAALWQFSRDFPATTRFGRLDRLCQIGLRVGLVVGATLFVTNLIPVFGAESQPARLVAPLQRLTGDGPLFWDLVFGVAIPALLVIANRGRFAIGAERVRVRVFLYSVALSFGPIMTQVFIEGLFPNYMRLMRTPTGLFWSGLFVYPPMFVLPIATAYTVTAENVLGVRVVVQRGLRYLLARWLLMWGAAVPLGILMVHLYRHAAEPLDTSLLTPPAPLLLWITGAGGLVLASRNVLVRALDRWALTGAEAPSAMLAHMTERFKQARTPLEVASTFAEDAEKALQSPATAYVCVNGALASVSGGVRPPRDSVIQVLLNGSREPCFVSANHRQSYYMLMTDNDRRWIEREGIEVIVPVLTTRTSASLLAVVALKSRKNALAFSQDDMRFLRAAAAAASLAGDAIESEGRESPGTLEEVALQCAKCGRVEVWTSESQACSCGGDREPAVLPKRVLARYEIHCRLGAGGMGVVYRATDLTLEREVAIKTLPLLSDEAAARLTFEARMMASLAHSDVAILYGAERWRGTPLLIMEYLPGGSLAQKLLQGPLGASEAIRMIHRLAAVLVHVHEANRYHGDIKPGNIGFSSDRTPKLLDFGLAQAISLSESPEGDSIERGAFGGTLAYLSPEVRGGAPPGPALDLWALSLVLCEALLGTHPFPGARHDNEVARGVTVAVSRLRDSISADACEFLLQSLSIVPALRPPSAREFHDALGRLTSS